MKQNPEVPENQAAPEALGKLLFLALLLTVGWVWGDLLGLALTGEDWTILARLRDGGSVAPHLFRPLLDPVLGGLHSFFGVDSPVPYHAASLILHGTNVLLAFALIRGLGFGTAQAAVGCALFALGAAATDALAWVAAINRPLSSLGALITLNGVARIGRGTAGEEQRWPLFALALGFLLQLGSNEEAYGTAAFVIALFIVRRRDLPRGPLLGIIALFVAAIALHAGLLQPEGSKVSALDPSVSSVFASFTERTALVARGLSLPGWIGALLPPLAALALAAARRTGPGLFLFGWWVFSFCPFVLSDPHPYRAYPTLAATSALVGCGFFAVLELLGARRPRTQLGAAVLVLLLTILASAAPRRERIERWRSALVEIQECESQLIKLPGGSERPPRLVNLETSTCGLFAYRFGVDPATLLPDGFLDTPRGFVRPTATDAGPWFGRRCEGSFGWIEPETYFAGRSEVPRVSIVEQVVLVDSLVAALAELELGRVDVTRAVVVERGLAPEGLQALTGWDEGDVQRPEGTVTVRAPLAPLPGDGLRARMEIEVQTARPAVLAIREPELYKSVWRLAPDNALFNGLGEATRGLRMTARDEHLDEPLSTFPIDAYGLGVLLPAGTRVVVLEITLSPATDLH